LTLTTADPDLVATAALTAYYQADTALDLGPADTHRRALPWTTGQLATGIRRDRPVTGPGAPWTALADHHGYTTVTITRAYDDGAPTDTRAPCIDSSPLRAHDTQTDFLTLTRTRSGWRITALQDQQ